MADGILIRGAERSDLPRIRAIYNHYVQHSTATWQCALETAEERESWFAAHGARHPVVVAEDAGAVIAWGALSSFRSREGYDATAETSVYVHHEHHRRGLGRAILAELIDQAGRLGHHTIVAGCSAEQAASIELHRAFGFVEVARMPRMGRKFGRWLDLVFLLRHVAEVTDAVPTDPS